jgi:hypothetical protein
MIVFSGSFIRSRDMAIGLPDTPAADECQPDWRARDIG